MSGLVKAKRYDWKDSNLALFGSALDKSVKKESALKEPAWKEVGGKVGLKIWRIVKFKVTEWPEKDYGSFFSGDSYIILNTYKLKDREELGYDVHFWIGSKSTQDEYASAAYKTVELDVFLDDAAIQHRDVEGNESDLFLSYFENGLTIMEGGAESGFHYVKPDEYKPRLLHFSGLKKHIVVKEVPLCPQRLKSDDVFILDLGRTLYQWNGSGSNKDERFKAMQYLQNLKAERGDATSKTLEEEHTDKAHPFYAALTGEDEPDSPEDQPDVAEEKVLLRVSDAAGHLKSTVVKKGHIVKSDLDSKDVFIVDTGDVCFVWVGNEATAQEKRNGLGYAHSHLMKTHHPLIPIYVIKEGQSSKAFNAALAA